MFCMLKRQKPRRTVIQNLRRNSQRMDRQSGAPLIAFMARAIAIIGGVKTVPLFQQAWIICSAVDDAVDVNMIL